MFFDSTPWFSFTGNPSSLEDIKRVDDKVLAFMQNLACHDERVKTTGSNAVTFQGIFSKLDDDYWYYDY
jgi:hypothetical protein